MLAFILLKQHRHRYTGVFAQNSKFQQEGSERSGFPIEFKINYLHVRRPGRWQPKPRALSAQC